MRRNRAHRHGPVALFALLLAALLLAACTGTAARAPSEPPANAPTSASSPGGGALDYYDLVFAVAGDSRSELDWVDTKSKKPDYGKYINKAALGALNNALVAKRQGRQGFFLMHLGDFAMRGGEKVMSAVKQTMAPLTGAGIPMYASIGNHEIRYYEFEKTGDAESAANAKKAQKQYQDAYANGWLMPADATSPQDYGKLAYHFKRGSSAFIVLDAYYVNTSEKHYKKGYYTDFQLGWLENMLKTYRADQSVKHIFVMSHQPVFNADGGEGKLYTRYDELTPEKGRPKNASARSNWILWALLDYYKVDVFFCGHSHFYHRWDVKGDKFEYRYGADKRYKDPWPALGKTFEKSVIATYTAHSAPWQTAIPQVLNGTCGAKPQGFSGNSLPAQARANAYNFSIVYVKGDAVTVDVWSYSDDKGTIKEPTMADKFRKAGGVVTTLPLQPEPT